MQQPGALQRLKDMQKRRQVAGISGQKQHIASSSDADNEAYMQQFEQAFSSISTQHAGHVSHTSHIQHAAAQPSATATNTGFKNKAPLTHSKKAQAATSSTSSMIASSSSSLEPGRNATAAASSARISSKHQLQAATRTDSIGHPPTGDVVDGVDLRAAHAVRASITRLAAAVTPAAHAACEAAAAVAPGWSTGPVDKAGVLVQLSERPIMCSAANWVSNEVVVGSSDHALYTVDLASSKKRRTLYTKTCGHTEWVTCVCYLPSGRVLSGGMDGRLWLWPSAGSSGTELPAAHAAPVSKVACLTPAAAAAVAGASTANMSRGSAAAGPVLAASCSYDQTVKVWDVSGSRGRQVSELRGHAGPVLEMDVNLTDQTIVTGDRKGNLMCWDLAAGSNSWGVAAAHHGHITALAWQLQQCSSSSSSSGGSAAGCCAISGGQDGHVRVWDGRSGSCVADQAVHVDARGKGAVGSIVPGSSSTGGHVVTAGADMTLKVLEPAMSYRSVYSIRLTDFPYALAAIGGLAVCGCGDGSVHVADVASGRTLYALGAGKAAIRALEVSAGRLVCAGDDGYVIAYDFM